MEFIPLSSPHLSQADIEKLINRELIYPGLERLFGHFSKIYLKYLSQAMDHYSWFRYVEAEAKNHILKATITRALKKFLKSFDHPPFLGGNREGMLRSERASGLTVRGINYKSVNEDGFGIFDHQDLLRLVVCDGVGDCLVGEVATQVILSLFHQQNALSCYDLFLYACRDLAELEKKLVREIPEFSSFPNELSQAAAMALQIAGDQCEVSSVGDIILFWQRENTLKMLNPQGQWLSLPQLTALFADHQYLAKRHIISNAIGRNYNPNWIPWTFTLKPGDKLILASDGIETLHPKTVFQILLEGHPLHQLPKIFFERVMEANQKWQTTAAAIFTKPDNFTVVVYEHQ